ncbi:MAG: hypothetical protein ACXVZP_00705 [Gaiellaceae bacterium]
MATLEQHRRAAAARQKRIPLRYWLLWWSLMVVADLVFYVLLTPIWMGLRAVAWLTEMWSRLRRGLRRS